jgi:hypothetical protein
MARRLVDLSIPITNDIISDPDTMRPHVSYTRHVEGRRWRIRSPA